MLAFFRFLSGYLRIRVSGYSPERFMNLCSNRGILLWDVTPSREYYEMNISLKGFYSIRNIVKKTKTHVKILERKGLPFSIAKLKGRKFFVLGFLGCFCSLIVLTRFIWAIDLEGNEQLTKDMLIHFLEEQQVTYGISKNELNISDLEKALRNEYNFITWTSVKVEGTKLTVYVKENEIIMEEVSKTEESSDLIASHDGIIESIITRSGVPNVTEGTEVKRGDILIAGAVPIIGDDQLIKDYLYCQADGDVYIRTTYTYEDFIPLEYETKMYTGEIHATYTLNILHMNLDLLSPPDNGTYSVVSDVHQLKLGEDFYLPVSWRKNEYSKYKAIRKMYENSEMEVHLNKNLNVFSENLAQKGVQIIQKNVRIVQSKEGMKMEGTLLVSEKAQERKLISPIPIINEADEMQPEESSNE